MSYGTDAPDYRDPSFEQDGSGMLGEAQCVIGGEHFFIRGRIVIPLLDGPAGAEFDWGVWVSASRASFERASELWNTPGREQEPPYLGWPSTGLPPCPASTLSLRTHVHAQAAGARPLVELEPPTTRSPSSSAPAARSRAQEIADLLLHGQ